MIADEDELPLGPRPGQVLDEVRVEPLGDRAVVADDWLADAGQVAGSHGRCEPKVLEVGRIGHLYWRRLTGIDLPEQDLRGDQDGVALLGQLPLGIGKARVNVAEPCMEVHAVIDELPPQASLELRSQRFPEGQVDKADAILDVESRSDGLE